MDINKLKGHVPDAVIAQLVEHVLGKDGVTGSSLVGSSINSKVEPEQW